MRNSVLGVLLGLAPIVLGACRDDEFDTPARFVLATVNGVALPAIDGEDADSTFVVTADTILFNSGGSGVQVRHGFVARRGEPDGPPVSQSWVFWYRLDRAFVEITRLCGVGASGANCVDTPHARGGMTTTELTLLDLENPVVRHYQRR